MKKQFDTPHSSGLRKYPYANLPLLGWLLSCSIVASAQTYPFEGYWGDDSDCSIENASAQYTSEYTRFNMLQCDYSGIYGKIEPIAPNRWKIQATCLVPFTEEDENGETWRGNRDIDSLFELTLNGNQLTKSEIIDTEENNQEPDIIEYYRCNNTQAEEKDHAEKITVEEAKDLFELAEHLSFRAELAEPPSAAEKKQIYRLYQAAYDGGYKKAAGALGIATLYGYNQAGNKDAQPDWDKAAGLFQEGIALNDTRAMRGLALMYRKGLGSIEQKPTYCIALYERASDLGDPQAIMRLGIILSKQTDTSYKEMSEEHLPLISPLPNNDEWRELYEEARQFDEMVDIPRGLALLEQAAKAGNLTAWKVLARYYYVHSKEKNLEREEYYLYEGAKRGNGELLAELAMRFVGRSNEDLASDLTIEERYRLYECYSTLFQQLYGDFSDTAGKEKNIPIPDLYERCPRYFTEENHAS